jgi:flagellar M-ring protein FliF
MASPFAGASGNPLVARLDAFRKRAIEVVAGFTTGQKVVSALAVGALVVAVVLVSGWNSKPSYAALYTNLETADAAGITEALTTQHVPFQLADGGKTVMVRNADLYRTRIDLSAQGLPSGGTAGWQILDKQGITASEFRQRVDYQRALEGELAKTIGAIDGVDNATVHLVIPQEDLFAKDDRKATAAVLIRNRTGATLNSREVQAVVHLVASSVEGLAPEQVTVTDATGKLLSAPGQDDLAETDARTAQTASFERQIAGEVKAMLASVVGTDGADVRVKAELDFDERNTTTEAVNPDQQSIVNQQTTTETFTNTNGATPGGPLGAELPTTTGSGNSNYAKNTTTQQVVPSKTTSSVKGAPGAVKRLSVSVLLDQDKASALNVQTIQQQVAAAAGIDAARGDTVQVSRVPFDKTVATQEAADKAKQDATARRQDLIRLAQSLGTLLLVAVGLRVGYKRLRGEAIEELIPLDQLALESASVDALLELDDEVFDLEPTMVGTGEDGGTVLVQRRQRVELDRLPGVEERMAAHADIVDLIDRRPEDVAQLLRSWIADR